MNLPNTVVDIRRQQVYKSHGVTDFKIDPTEPINYPTIYPVTENNTRSVNVLGCHFLACNTCVLYKQCTQELRHEVINALNKPAILLKELV